MKALRVRRCCLYLLCLNPWHPWHPWRIAGGPGTSLFLGGEFGLEGFDFGLLVGEGGLKVAE